MKFFSTFFKSPPFNNKYLNIRQKIFLKSLFFRCILLINIQSGTPNDPKTHQDVPRNQKYTEGEKHNEETDSTCIKHSDRSMRAFRLRDRYHEQRRQPGGKTRGGNRQGY